VTNTRHSTKQLGRREALQLFGAGFAVGGLSGLCACGQKQEPAPAAPDPSTAAPPAAAPPSAAPAAAAAPSGPMTCESPVDAAAQQLRGSLQYLEVAAVPEKHCAVCAQFVPAKFGECGGCNLFGGPVKPLGGCLAFAPKDPNAPPAATKPG
jgi:hypothetical protein